MLKKIRNSKTSVLVLIAVLIFVFFTLINKNYAGLDNLGNMMVAAAVSGVVTVGMGCLLISGEADLSAAAVLAAAGVICAMLLQAGLPWVVAVIITLLYGVCAGLINAFLIYKLHFFSFIGTMSMQYVWTGLTLFVTKQTNIPINNESFWKLGGTRVFGFIPLPFIITVLLFVVYGYILSNTAFGRKLYMIGGNRNAARLAGINGDKMHTIMLINCSTLSAFAGVVQASRMHSAMPTAQSTASLDAITAACLGGISFMGGSGSMFGGFVGLMMLILFKNGLTVAEVNSYWCQVANGLVLIAALALDYVNELSRQKALKAGTAN